MSVTKILIVEDDKDLSSIMKDYLRNEGYEVIEVHSGSEACVVAKDMNPTLIILDIMLPGVDGIEVCRQIRSYSHCPIMIISAKSSDSDKLLSLGMGADDYLTKPFSLPELVGRVKSHIRRFTSFTGNSASQGKRTYGRLCIDVDAFVATVDGKEVPLTSKEFKLLEFLSSHPTQVFSKEQIIDQVWGYEEYLGDNTIAVYVGRLREKLAKEKVSCIKTVWGVGYKWNL